MSGSTTTQLTIINRGLQLLGYKAVTSFNQNDRGARAMQTAYIPVLESLLRANFWGFSISRAQLPASTTQPAFGPSNYFPLPGDFIILAPMDQGKDYIGGGLSVGVRPLATGAGIGYSDWTIERFPGGGKAIASDDSGPIYIRYVSNAVTEGDFDPDFSEAFAAALAMDTCEQLTQNNSKLQNAEKSYDDAMKSAKKRNAFESMPVRPPVDTWILKRL